MIHFHALLLVKAGRALASRRGERRSPVLRACEDYLASTIPAVRPGAEAAALEE